MILNIDKDIINLFFNTGEMFIEECYFKNCKLYTNFN